MFQMYFKAPSIAIQSNYLTRSCQKTMTFLSPKPGKKVFCVMFRLFQLKVGISSGHFNVDRLIIQMFHNENLKTQLNGRL